MLVNGKEQSDETIEKLFGNFVFDPVEAEEKCKEHEAASEMECIRNCNRTSNIPKRYAKARFSDYKDETGVTNTVKEFALKMPYEALLLAGPTGVGKTSLMCSALHERAVLGLSAGLYFNVRFLMPILRTCRSFSAKENEESFIRRLAEIPFLCIDEIGASSNLKEEGEFIALLICARYDNKLPTFLATNLDTLNFSLLLAGVDINEIPASQKKELCLRLKKTNATLDRFNSIARKVIMQGESYRVVQEG